MVLPAKERTTTNRSKWKIVAHQICRIAGATAFAGDNMCLSMWIAIDFTRRMGMVHVTWQSPLSLLLCRSPAPTMNTSYFTYSRAAETHIYLFTEPLIVGTSLCIVYVCVRDRSSIGWNDVWSFIVCIWNYKFPTWFTYIVHLLHTHMNSMVFQIVSNRGI